MRTARYDKVITVDGISKTINEWAHLNNEKPCTIYNRRRRNNTGMTNYTPGQIVGSEDLPEPKASKNIKPEVYKKGKNIKAKFDGSKLMLAFSKFNLLNATKFVYDENETSTS